MVHLSCGDDKVLCKWSADGQSAGKIGTINAYGTSISVSGKQAADMFALSCTDGTVRFLSKSSREEKKFSAHEELLCQFLGVSNPNPCPSE